MSTVTLPARTLTILDSPVTLPHAVTFCGPDGVFTAVLAVPTEEMTGENTYDAFYDNLVNRLITGCDAYLLTYQILGASEDGETLYVQVSNNLIEAAAADPDMFLAAGLTRAGIKALIYRR